MIDLHNHILPGLDDGAQSIEEALEMARLAVADGSIIFACTPHIVPGVYNNEGPNIVQWVHYLQAELDRHDIYLNLIVGADVHLAPDLVPKLRSGLVPSLNGGRYVLIEPPHHILPPRAEYVFFDLLSAGYIPILTHPERMAWIGRNYDLIGRLVEAGAWMQLTAASVAGKFGDEAEAWSRRLLRDGLAHIVASDAHHPTRRPPMMRAATAALEAMVGKEEAENLVLRRPEVIVYNREPGSVPLTRAATPERLEPAAEQGSSFWSSVGGYFRGK